MEALKRIKERLEHAKTLDVGMRDYPRQDMDKLVRAIERYNTAMIDIRRWPGADDTIHEVEADVNAILEGT